MLGRAESILVHARPEGNLHGVTPASNIREMSTVTIAENVTYNLRAEIAARGISQAALSRLSGVRQATISDVLSGKIEPTFETLERIAAALEISPTRIFLDPPAKAS